MRNVIELRRIVNRAEESGQIVKEPFLSAADKCLDHVAVGCFDLADLVRFERCGKVARLVKIQKLEVNSLIAINIHAYL